MASIILKSAGAAIGSALVPGFGTYFGSLIGSAAGGLIDQKIGTGAHVTGPRLDNLTVQDSRYGTGIPIVYGTARIAGNVIWSTDLIQAIHNSNVGGKGGFGSSVSSTTYSYSLHCAVGIAAGPIGGISTIWADSTIIYQNGVWTSGVVDAATIYLGSPTQAPDPFMESILGAGSVPAYRGLAYIVFENLQLADFGNRLPNLTFEITPALASNNPTWLGSVDASVSQRQHTMQSGGMLPITLSGSGNQTHTLLLGGYIDNGTNSTFEAVSFDVSGDVPVEISRNQSASFATNIVSDSSWAPSPDGRFIAMYAQSSSMPSHQFAIYDTETGQFGNVLGVNIPTLTVSKQIAWIDAQRFVIDDTAGGARGLHVFARAGLDIVDLGYWNVWGAGTASTRLPLAYAQFMPSAGGLLNYMTNSAVPYFTTLYARQLNWQNNTLVIGTSYVVASGLTPTNSGNGHANLIHTGDGEYTLCFGTLATLQLMSFQPTPTSATVTRPWQTFTPSFGYSTTQFPLFYGDRLVILQGSSGDNFYRLSEINLNAGNFSLTIDGMLVNSAPSHTFAFCGIALDSSRFLLLGNGGFAFDILQCAIVKRCDNGTSLDNITADILNRAGYNSGDYDLAALSDAHITGYVLSEPMSARSALEPLQVYAPFDLIESNSLLHATPRHGTADIMIDANEWRAVEENKAPPPALNSTRAQELDLPREVDVDYIDIARNFEVNSARARRTITQAKNVQKINLPVVCSSSAAKSIAETRLFALWAERDFVRLYISRRWLALDVGDVVDLNNGDLLRVTKIQQIGSLLEVEGFYVNHAAYSSSATGDGGSGVSRAAAPTIPDSQIYLLDLPLLQNSDNQAGVYVASGGLNGWTGASLWRANDGVNYNQIASLTTPATTGFATSILANGSSLYIDNANSVNVQMNSGNLSSCTINDVYNGTNAALLGSEIIQFQTASLIGSGLYKLSNLLRGRRGTETATTTHSIGENFVLLNSGSIEFVPALLTDRGANYQFRALSKGQTLGAVCDMNFTYSLATLQPLAPVNITGVRASGTGSDLVIAWKRRARLNAEWVNFVDVPLDEPTELYDVEIMNGSTVLRTFSNITTPNVTYTSAQQSSDWGSVPSSFTVNIYQISSRYGRGKAGSAII